ncbi:MAG: proline dehydrogenase family protein [Pirellulaceae bacterium]|nr:proline dehydrogenase family protein [Planctomycetales bacterium]
MAPLSQIPEQDPADRVTRALIDFHYDPQSPLDRDLQQTLYLARLLQQRASQLQTPQERRQQSELDRMMHAPGDKVTLMQMTDQAFRAQRAPRAVDQLVHILDAQGIPRFFTSVDRALLRGFQTFGSYLPGVAVPFVKEKMQHETANVVLPAESELLCEHLRRRRDEGVRMNVNHLGEALLGEDQAQQRLRDYLQVLQLPDIEVISVKISTIYSQISPLARRHTVAVLGDRLELLFRAAARGTFSRSDGSTVAKFVYLDMEEYRDLWLTADAFMATLDRPGMQHISAGIALQSYVPDSFSVQEALVSWACQRVEHGGAPITLRIVKGANLEMERVDASLHDWPQAPYKSKLETDANYRRMLHYAFAQNRLRAVRLGVASHNLFELAYGLVMAWKHQAIDFVQFEMLEGMANHQRRALFELCRNLLLYAPACRREDFINAIGYLVRRLDENTGPQNFLRHAFRLRVGSNDWQQLEQGFLKSHRIVDKVAALPRRQQDRREQPVAPDPATRWGDFRNEPDTDFSLPHHSQWAEEILNQWSLRHGMQGVDIPLVIGGQEIFSDDQLGNINDPSRPGVVVGRYCRATAEQVDQAVVYAVGDSDQWRQTTASHRRQVLREVAQQIRLARGRLMGAALADAGKILTESDPEVSEAVDFVEFYSLAAEYFEREFPRSNVTGRGVVAVVSPWNFPIAIPCGGIAAALAAGNSVLLKPASDAVLVAYELCRCFWQAGVPGSALQFVPCLGNRVAPRLVGHERVDTVVLTGGTATALQMLKDKPSLRLLAETGGKNATIVTALADRDLAIKNVVHSAFSHSGQKCSATSLLILEDEVFHDDHFRESLRDAAASLTVGSAWDLTTRVGPLIRPPSGVLETALKELEPDESWLLMPRRNQDNPALYSPAIKWGVRSGSFTHMTEFFGPVLAVMRARDLSEAIALANDTGYGLTSGLESLDDREQELWKENIRAGNLYINRGTTGAIVLRQPFGGMGKSAFGPGIQAGGPNYVTQLMRFRSDAIDASPTPRAKPVNSTDTISKIGDPEIAELLEHLRRSGSGLTDEQRRQLDQLVDDVANYQQSFEDEFQTVHDHFKLLGQDNLRRYLPVREIRIRYTSQDSPLDLLRCVVAAKLVGCRATLSYAPGAHPTWLRNLDAWTESWAGAIEFVEEQDALLAHRIQTGFVERVRFCGPDRVPNLIRSAAASSGAFLADEPVQMQGRIELLWYVREQSISSNYHRYGNLGARADEPRREPE